MVSENLFIITPDNCLIPFLVVANEKNGNDLSRTNAAV